MPVTPLNLAQELTSIQITAGSLLKPELKKIDTVYMNRPQRKLYTQEDVVALLKRLGYPEPDFKALEDNIDLHPKLECTMERNSEGTLYGYLYHEDFAPIPYSRTEAGLKENLKKLMKDHQQHEGKHHPFWSRVNVDELEIEMSYERTGFVSRKAF